MILNEVNSSNPSVLKGYVEVAGKKADVIIANPSGIHCEGCGVINSERATLTTGKPQIQNGNLESFVVEKGKVKVSGKGMDNSRVDYTEILAREAELNAGIWSKKETKVVTGKNTLKRSGNGKDLQIIHTNQPLAEETSPKFAVDVGELGGMYAGKIHLIGTEEGVGVRNAGHLGASAATVKIDSRGRIVNTGTINAQDAILLSGEKGVENRGKIENQRGDLELISQKDVQQDGTILARGGNLQKSAKEAISQQGESVAKGHIRYQAPNVTASTQSLIAAGVEIQSSEKGDSRQLETRSALGKNITVVSSDKAKLHGRHMVSGALQVEGQSVDLNQSQTVAYGIEVQAKTGDIQANHAALIADKTLTLDTPAALSTQNSTLKAESIRTQQRALNSQNAIWEQTGTETLALNVTDKFQNQGGTFKTQGDMVVNAKGMENQQGRLLANGKLTLNSGKETLDSREGTLASAQHLEITSGQLINDQGVIQSAQDVVINTQGQAFSNQDTLTAAKDKGVIAQGNVTLTAGNVNNNDGHILSYGNSQITTSTLTNDRGQIRTAERLVLNTDKLSQQKGLIAAGALDITTRTLQSNQRSEISGNQIKVRVQQLDNRESKLIARQQAELNVSQDIQNQQGILASLDQNLNIDVRRTLNNDKGIIVAQQGNLTLNAKNLTNQQGIVRANNANITTQQFDNRNTLADKTQGLVANQLTLQTAQLENQLGRITATGNATLKADTLQNQAGEIFVAQQGQLNVQHINNQAGWIASTAGSLVIETQTELDNQQGHIGAKTNLSLNTQGINNQQGHIIANDLNLATYDQAVNNQKGTILASRQAVLNTGEINSQQGVIRAKDLMIDTQKQHINNQEGEMSAKVATITAQRIDNQSGEINANRAEITTAQLDNRVGEINAEQMTLSSQQVDNQSGKINASMVTMVAQQVDNQAGIIKANDATITANILNNRAISEKGSLVSANNLTLNLAELDNQGTKANGTVPTQGIHAKQFTLNASQLANQQGGIYSNENVTLNVAERVDNQQGELLALNKVAIQNQDKLMLNNQDGMIQGHQQVNLNLKGIESEGTIKTAGDLSVDLKESFTLNKAFEVGNNLMFKTEGDFVNNAVQAVGKSATFTAAHIINQANAEISGVNTTLNAQSTTNRGLIDGGNVLLNSSTVTNIGTGRIYGDHLAFKANTVENLAETVEGETKAGTIAADVVNIATERFSQLGGKTQAVENLTVFANQSLEIASTLANATSRDGNFSRTMLDKTASLSVTGKNGEMNLLSNGDITVKAADIQSEGKVTIDGKRVNITTVQTHNKEHYNGDADNYYRLDQKAEVGSRISGKAGVSVISDTDNTLRQASLSSENGLVEVGSREGNVTIEAGRAEEQLATSSKSISRKLFNKTTTINRHYHDNREAVGSNLEGEQVHIWSNNADVLVKGSNLLGDKGVEIEAKNNASVIADTNYFKEVNQTERKKSGLMGSGGIGFTIGKKSEKHDYESEGWTQSDARSVVGSQQGNIRISAGHHAQVTGTDLITPRTQRVDIIGSSTKVEAGKDIIETKENHEYKQSGLTLALSSSVTDAVMDARQSVRRADEVKSDKLKTLYAMKAADDAYRAVESFSNVSNTIGNLMNGTMQNNGAGENPSIKVSVSYGSQKTVERKSGKEITHSKSNISTGELNVKARDGKAVFEGVDTTAKTIQLSGKQGVEIKGVKDESHQRTENKSSGGSVGVFVGASNGSYGFGVEGSVNVAKGKSNSDSDHWQNSVFNADKIITDSEEGGLTLDAANFKTKRWEGDIQHLTLTSRQDTEKYNSKQTSAKASGSVAYGASGASVAASYSKAKVDYAQVNQQTGIEVGEEGMNVTVHNHTQLDGAFIDSKATTENNRFKTKSIDYRNIDNHSEIKTESASVSAGSGGMNPMQAISSALSLLGNGNEQTMSQTKAAIGQNIQVETETPENLQGLSRDVANANQQVQKQSLEKMQERQEMAKVIGELADSGLKRLTEEPLKEANAKRQQAEAIAKENSTQAEVLKAEAKAIEAEYGLGSDLQMGVRAATAALQGLATNDVNQALVGAASPYLNQEIKKRTTNADGTVNTQANLIAHALLGAAEAKMTGNNALAGATAAVTAEAAPPYIMQTLYQTDNPVELNETQKRNVANLSQIAAGLSSGLVGDSMQNAVAGAEIGKRAVENNFFMGSVSGYELAYSYAKNDKNCDEKCKKELDELKEQHRKIQLQGSLAGLTSILLPELVTSSVVVSGAFGGGSELIG